MENLRKIKVLLAENIHPSAEEAFLEAGIGKVDRLSYAPSEDELIDLFPKYHVIGIRSRSHLNAKVLASSAKFSAIGCFCIGTNQVDLKYAKQLGIPVFNAPYSNTRSVAEMAIALVIVLFRHLFEQSQIVHQGGWNKSATGSHEIRGKKLGIIGYGHIGKQLGALAESLGMQVCYYDIQSQLSLGNAKTCPNLTSLLKESDVVTLHVPETNQTKMMIGKEQLQNMKKGSYLLNLSRGTVVDIEALAEFLKNGHLAGAAIDVFPAEPSGQEAFFSPLQNLKNVVLTPHIGGSTEEAQESIGKEVSARLLNFLTTASTQGAVNMMQFSIPASPNSTRFVHMHKNVPGILALINEVFSKYQINIVGQFLQTDADIGCAVIDAEPLSPALRDEVKQRLREIENTLRAYPIY